MSKSVFQGPHFTITHTREPEGPHLTSAEHYEETVIITALLKGKGVCYVEENNYQLSAGDLIVCGLNEIHAFCFEQEGYHERLSFYLDTSVLSLFWEYELPLMQIFENRPPGVGNLFCPAEYDDVGMQYTLSEICRLTDCSDKREETKSAKLYLHVLQLLFILHDSFAKRRVQVSPSDNISEVSEICRYIREHLEEDLSYKRLQEQFLISRYQLTVVFRRKIGMTLTEYILQKRLMMVSALVRNGKSISEAAQAAGFGSYSHFYKEFVKRKRISPCKYYAADHKSSKSNHRWKQND